jgi:mannose-6-phosphate isomerase-like protein (cupin superfamily)
MTSALDRFAPIRLSDKLATFDAHWSPRTVALFNTSDVMVAKIKGEYHWHKHDDTDDCFFVLKGVLDIELRDRIITLQPGDLYVVPKGVEHRQLARDELHILLMETSGTLNSGNTATAAPRTFA